MIPYGKHYLDEVDIEAVVSVLRSGSLTQGVKVAEFEKSISEYTGSKYAVATSNGTSALHISLLIANVEKDDEVVDGKSIMGLMMLAAGNGSVLHFTAEGEDSKSVLSDLEALFEGGFNEG